MEVFENADIKWARDLCHSPFSHNCMRMLYHSSRGRIARSHFQIYRKNVHGEMIENDTKTIVRTESIFGLFG